MNSLCHSQTQHQTNSVHSEIVEVLSKGQVQRVRFTVPEGFTVVKTAKKIEAEGLGSAEKFIEAARNYTPYPYMETSDPNVTDTAFHDRIFFLHQKHSSSVCGLPIKQIQQQQQPESLRSQHPADWSARR